MRQAGDSCGGTNQEGDERRGTLLVGLPTIRRCDGGHTFSGHDPELLQHDGMTVEKILYSDYQKAENIPSRLFNITALTSLSQLIAGADAFVTGEMHYHDYFDTEQKIQIAVLGHYQSEQYTTEIFKSIIENNCPGVPCFITKINTNPIIYI